MLPALSGWTWARVAPSTPFQCMTTGNDAATSLAFTLNDEPVTVTVSPGLPAELDRLRVARFVHANAAAPAMTVTAAADPKTRVTFLRRFIAKEPTFALVAQHGAHRATCFCTQSLALAERGRNKHLLYLPGSHLDAHCMYPICIASD